jgi:cell division protein FtsL
MISQAVVWLALGGLLLCCIGMLFGATWTTQALQPKLGQLADERRRLNDEWMAIRAAHRQLERCPRCGYPLTEAPWFAPTLTKHSHDDD